MTEQFAISQSASIKAHEGASAIPLLFRSSEESNWEGLVVRAFHEPEELEGWIDPVAPDTSLVLVTQGAMYMEQRLLNGPWRGQHIRQGDLFLKPGGSGPYELRWRSLSPEPLRTLHLHLNTHLLARTAEEVADRDPARLALIGHSGFQDPLLTQIGLALWRELEQRAPAGKLYAQTAAQMLAIHLLRYYTSVGGAIEEPLQGLTHHQMRRVIDFVQDHLSQELSLEALAQAGILQNKGNVGIGLLASTLLAIDPSQEKPALQTQQAALLMKRGLASRVYPGSYPVCAIPVRSRKRRNESELWCAACSARQAGA